MSPRNRLAGPQHLHSQPTGLRIVLMIGVVDSDTEPDEYKKILWDKYEKGPQIGAGVYGTVYRCRNKVDGRIVAIKKMPNTEDGPSPTTMRELAALTAMDHPFIVDLYEYIHAKAAFYLVLEYAETDLHQYIKCSGEPGLKPIEVKHFTYQLLLATHHCHARRFMHRDLKPRNILVQTRKNLGRPIIKLIDFGLARTISNPLKPNSPEVNAIIRSAPTQIQTVIYRAPEVQFQRKNPGVRVETKTYNSKVDVWSVGCIMAEMLKGTPIFYGATEIAVKRTILNIFGAPDSEDFDFAPELEYFKDIPKEPVTPLETIVPTLDEDGLDLLTRMFRYSPQKRIHVIHALKHPYFDEIRGEYENWWHKNQIYEFMEFR
ncbi:Cyclin-dependent kinase 2 [Irineochytrium annulatum]|nr:Cyclin-dependent kinase 2 [Irineochytrium annulatum]